MLELGAFLIGFFQGLVTGITAGGGLVSISGLILLGASPIVTVATTRLSALSAAIALQIKYRKSHSVQWKYMPYFLVFSLFGGIIGPHILLSIDKEIVGKVIGVLLLILLPLLLRKNDFGVANIKRKNQHHLLGLFAFFLVMTYGAAFGSGAGIFLMYVLMYFYGMTVIQANVTGSVAGLVTTVIAIITYTANGVVDFSLGIPLLIGAAIGGYLGAHMALKKGTVWVKQILIVVVVLSSIKLLFF